MSAEQLSGAGGQFDPERPPLQEGVLTGVPLDEVLAEGVTGSSADGDADGDFSEQDAESLLAHCRALEAEQEHEAWLAEWAGVIGIGAQTADSTCIEHHNRVLEARVGISWRFRRTKAVRRLEAVQPNFVLTEVSERRRWGIRRIEETNRAVGWVAAERVLAREEAAPRPEAKPTGPTEQDDRWWPGVKKPVTAPATEPVAPESKKPKHDPSKDRELTVVGSDGELLLVVAPDTKALEGVIRIAHVKTDEETPAPVVDTEGMSPWAAYRATKPVREHNAQKKRRARQDERLKTYIGRNTARKRRLHLPGREVYTNGFTKDARLIGSLVMEHLSGEEHIPLGPAGNMLSPSHVRKGLLALAERFDIPVLDGDAPEDLVA